MGFLKTLDAKLHSMKESTFTPNLGDGSSFPVWVDTYTDERMTSEEAARVFRTVRASPLVIHPINTAMGFSVGFDIYNPITGRSVLRFKESQLPKEYDWNRMREAFMSPLNRILAKASGIRISDDREHYTY